MQQSPIPHKGRRAALIGVMAALVGGLGCATAVVSTKATQKAQIVNGEVILRDTVVAFGLPGPDLAKKLNRPAIAFIGKANTYLLVKGGEELRRIAQELPPQRINVTEDSGELYLDKGLIWGTLEIRYETPLGANLEDEQRLRLQQNGFAPIGSGHYLKRIQVEGRVYPALAVPPDSPHVLQSPRTLAFRAPPSGGGYPDLGYLAFLPAALAVDVITSPLQLMGFILLH